MGGEEVAEGEFFLFGLRIFDEELCYIAVVHCLYQRILVDLAQGARQGIRLPGHLGCPCIGQVLA